MKVVIEIRSTDEHGLRFTKHTATNEIKVEGLYQDEEGKLHEAGFDGVFEKEELARALAMLQSNYGL